MQCIYFVYLLTERDEHFPSFLYATNRFIHFFPTHTHIFCCLFSIFFNFIHKPSYFFFSRLLFDEYRILKGIRECKKKKYDVITPKIFHKYVLNLIQNSGMIDWLSINIKRKEDTKKERIYMNLAGSINVMNLLFSIHNQTNIISFHSTACII